MRWALTTFFSKGMPKSVSTWAAFWRVGQSELEPMMMPTRGLLAAVLLIGKDGRMAAGWHDTNFFWMRFATA